MQNNDNIIAKSLLQLKRKTNCVNDTSIICQNSPSGVTNEPDFDQTLSSMKSKFPYARVNDTYRWAWIYATPHTMSFNGCGRNCFVSDEVWPEQSDLVPSSK